MPMPDARVVALAALASAAACGRSPERARVDFERMRRQQRVDLYAASGVFADGQSMHAPPNGTVTRETAADTGVVATGLIGGTATTTLPLAMTPARRAAGAKLFGIYCAVCHGVAGYGGSTVAENMGPPRPPSLRSARVVAMPAGHIFQVASRGLGRMPSYASELSTGERWAVVGYVQELQRTPTTSAEAIDDSIRAQAIQRIDSASNARRSR